MSSSPSPSSEPSSSPSSSLPRPKSGARAALEYTGIPPSWFDKRPKLPSRNWLIFLSVTSSIVGYYAYDRRQCRQIRQEYVNKVKHLAEEPLGSLEYPRKVTVYGAKWPGDEDWDRSVRYFRKYVKPILVAAAVDYSIIAGKRHGDLASRIANDIKSERRIALGLDPPTQSAMPQLATSSTPEEKRRRLLEGGTIVVGRPTFKEYMAGLHRGWTESLEKVDEEEQLSRQLEDDGHFDELETPAPSPNADVVVDGEPIPTPSRIPPSRPPGIFSPLNVARPPTSASSPSQPARDLGADVSPPAQIPVQPPLLLVPFVNLVGFKLVPNMLWDFFNERQKVKAGAEAAYKLIMCQTRPFDASSLSASEESTSTSDLAFDTEAEGFYKSSTAKLPEETSQARDTYYRGLAEKLKTARELARGEREPSSAERETPPPTEVELRAQRLKKELRWRGEEKGWDIVKPNTPVAWDEKMQGALRVFVEPSAESDEGVVAGSKSEFV
ncbi:inner membrane protein import complex subunit Tim54-domain-containing protein [Amylostereum chailletii]|nr:inner membrane protein import complex subunit Tim54-domain-containing protein [Amylostereum chailletii]